MKVSPIFAWYDMWIGFFWDKKKRWLYFFPIPMLGLIFKFKPNKTHWVVKTIVENKQKFVAADAPECYFCGGAARYQIDKKAIDNWISDRQSLLGKPICGYCCNIGNHEKS